MDKESKIILLVVLVLIAAVLFPSLFLGFNSFWDLYYVFENPFQSKLSLPLAAEAFTSFLEGNYHPLTLLSHSLDYTLWGNNPFGHHLANCLLHLGNVFLVFLIIYRLYPGEIRFKNCVCGLTALIFGLHPLRVESVVWITERKDVLFASFYLLAVLTYIKWRDRGGAVRYWISLLCFLFSALSKAMAVSLPLTVAILDYFFLLRREGRSWKRIIPAVLPFALIAAFTALMAVKGQRQDSLMAPLSPAIAVRHLLEFPTVPLFYLGKVFWPLKLSPIYPVEIMDNVPLILLGWLGGTGLLVLAVRSRKKYPAFLPAILLSIVLFLPVGGLVRVGLQTLADRFSYLPTLPLIFGVSWLLVHLFVKSRWKSVIGVFFLVWLGLLTCKTVEYTSIWDNPLLVSGTAYRYYPDTAVIELIMLRTYHNLAVDFFDRGETGRAMEYIRKTLRINPDFPDIYLVWAEVLLRQGDSQGALDLYRKALSLNPEFGNAYLLLGIFHAKRKEFGPAEANFKRAIFFGEDRVETRFNLGLVYARWGKLDLAEAEFKEAISFDRSNPQIYGSLSEVLRARGKLEEADRCREEAERLGKK